MRGYAKLKVAGVDMPLGNTGAVPWDRDLLFKDPSGSSIDVVQVNTLGASPE